MENSQHKEHQKKLLWKRLLPVDMAWILAGCVVVLILLKIFFMKTSIGEIARLIFGVLWIFVLPGYAIMIYWRKTLELKEVIVAGSLISAGFLGILGYYAGLIGIHAIYHKWILPPLIIILSILINLVIYFIEKKK